jgi:hypothetical protein
MRLILLFVTFGSDITDASAYFVVHDSFQLFVIISRDMSEHVSAGPLKACLKVDDCLFYFWLVH